MAGKYTFKRDFYADVAHSISNSRATFLLGARKCGKTVCLKQMKDEYENAEYIDFKEKSDKEKLEVFLQIQKSIENDENKIYLLDEITYAINPEINICILAGLFSEYDTKNVRIVFAGSQSLALEQWGHIAFGGSAGYVRPDFLSYAEWLRYKQISEPSAESYEQFLYGAMEFYGFTSMQDYLQGCIDETILSNAKTSNYIYGNDCYLLNADVLLDVCYATLFTLHNHVTNSTFMKNNGLKEGISTYFAKVCAELDLDARISDSFIKRYNSFERKDLKVLEQAFLFLRNCDLITVTPVVSNLDNIPDLEQEFKLIAHGEKPHISVKDDLFRYFNMCIKYPVFYVAILKDIFKEQMPPHLPPALLGSIMECQTRGLLSGKGAVEYRDLSGNEVDYVNVIDHTAVEITIANKALKDTHFDCLPDGYKCCLLTKDRTDPIGNIQQIPYYDFINNGAKIEKENILTNPASALVSVLANRSDGEPYKDSPNIMENPNVPEDALVLTAMGKLDNQGKSMMTNADVRETWQHILKNPNCPPVLAADIAIETILNKDQMQPDIFLKTLTEAYGVTRNNGFKEIAGVIAGYLNEHMSEKKALSAIDNIMKDQGMQSLMHKKEIPPSSEPEKDLSSQLDSHGLDQNHDLLK